MPAGPAPITATRRGLSAVSSSSSGTRAILTRAGRPAPARRLLDAAVVPQMQLWFRSSESGTYCVSVTRPPGTSGARVQLLFAWVRVVAPASQLLRPTRLLVDGTVPTITLHW